MRRVLIIAALLLGACTAAVAKMEAPVLVHPTLPTNLGQTVCSFNNQPVVLMDSVVLAGNEAEIIMVHEQTHAQRMREYKGGCFVYITRYAQDSAFRAREELLAYCAEARFAITRNRNAQYAWDRIKYIMKERYHVRLNDQDNCVYQSWTPNLGER